MPAPQPEPWLRQTHADLPADVRAVLHALEQASEDVTFWCGQLSLDEMESKPLGLPSAAFQMRHIAGSLDRLLTYAEGSMLNEEQREMLGREADAAASLEQIFDLFHSAMQSAMDRVVAFAETNLEEPRSVGRAQLAVTLGGLLVHIAEHTQRHVGQTITTVKVVQALKGS